MNMDTFGAALRAIAASEDKHPGMLLGIRLRPTEVVVAGTFFGRAKSRVVSATVLQRHTDPPTLLVAAVEAVVERLHRPLCKKRGAEE